MLIRDTLTRQAFDAVVNDIVERRLSPGDQLPSTLELTEMFGISRPVVREALSALHVCGFVDVRNGKAPVVGDFDGRLLQMFMARAAHVERTPMSRLMEVRIPLEIQAAHLAASRVNDVTMNQIDAANSQMVLALNDAERYSRLDADFHGEIAIATENQILILMSSTIRAELRATMAAVRLYRDTHALVGQEQKQHDEIAQAIRDRDPAAAAAAMERHLLDSFELVKKIESSSHSDASDGKFMAV